VSDTRDPETDQPLPTVADERLPIMHNLVTDDLQDRLALGIKKYGTGLRPFNGRSFLLDAYGEVLDLAVYLRGRIYEEEHPHPSPGRAQLRDRIAELLVITAHPQIGPEQAVRENLWGAASDIVANHWLERAENLLVSEPFRQAVDTIFREGLERGASPALQIILAEVQMRPAGTPKSYETGFQDGLMRAVELIAEETAANANDAFEAGRRLGREERS